MGLTGFKKKIAVLVIIWLGIIIAGLIFSRSMQGKIINILSEQASKYLTTEIHIRKNDIHFSVFKKFPLASVELRNVCVKIPPSVNLEESNLVQGDTLLYAKKLFLQLNIRSLLKKKYELEKISVNNGYIQIVSDKAGNSSLEIIKENKSSSSSPFAASINELSVNNFTVFTSDKTNQSQSTSHIKQGSASGTFSQNNFAVKLKTNGRIKKYRAKDQTLEPNQSFAIDSEIEFSNKRYTVKRGKFNLSNIPFTVVGSITPGDNTLIDIIFSAKSVPLKQIDKAVLSGLLGDSGFEPRDGTIDIKSTLVGYTRHTLPAIKASFNVKNGEVFDSKRKMLYKEIYVIGNADNGKEHLPKSTTVRVDSFSFITGESRQSGKLKIKNLIQPKLSATMQGSINVVDITSLIQIKNVNIIEGHFNNNVAVAGTINKNAEESSSLLDNLQIWGDLSIKDLGLVFENYQIPYTRISGDLKMDKSFTLLFDSLEAVSGHSDILINGKLTNILKGNGTPGFYGDVYSKTFLADDFITPSTSTTKETKSINFPDSLIVSGSAYIEDFTFGKFNTQNIKGNIEYTKKQLTMESFSMDGFDGTLKGKLAIKQLPTHNINMTTDASLSSVDIHQLFTACNNFSQTVIGSEHLQGKLSGHTAFSSEWTDRLKFIPSKAANQSNIVILNGELINYSPLMGLSNFIDVQELSHIKFDKLATSISIRNEKVYLDQTTIASSAITFDGSGIHGFDNKYEYHLQLGLSDVLYRKAKKKKKEVTEFGYIVDDGVGHTIIPIILSGIGTSFDVKYDKKKARNTFREKVTQEKKDLKELFKPRENQNEEIPDTELKIEHEDSDVQTLTKTDSGDFKVDTDEHSIIWDDSEDEEE